jgi:lipopolysaccharide transport system permease protein
MSSSPGSTQKRDGVLFIRPTRGFGSLNLHDLWVYRELIYFMTWRDLKVRYKQTALGVAWAVLQPFLRMVVFSFLFGGVAKLSSEGLPYPLFSFTGLLPWTLFAKALGDAGRSMVTNRNMITKVYFPRMIIPLASVLSGVVDFMIAFIVLVGMMIYYDMKPGSGFNFVWSWALLTLPLLLLLAMATALGASLWLSAMNVIYRDVGYILPFLTDMWFFITPVVYSTSEIPEKLHFLYAINPMTGVVEGFRWALLGTPAPGPMIIVSTLVTLFLLVTGLFYFRRMERSFADEI